MSDSASTRLPGWPRLTFGLRRMFLVVAIIAFYAAALRSDDRGVRMASVFLATLIVLPLLFLRKRRYMDVWFGLAAGIVCGIVLSIRDAESFTHPMDREFYSVLLTAILMAIGMLLGFLRMIARRASGTNEPRH